MFKIETERPRNFNKSLNSKNKEQIERQSIYNKNGELATQIIESLSINTEYPLYKFDPENNQDIVFDYVILLNQSPTEVLSVLYKNTNIRKPMTKIHFCRDTRLLIKKENSDLYILNQELFDKYVK